MRPSARHGHEPAFRGRCMDEGTALWQASQVPTMSFFPPLVSSACRRWPETLTGSLSWQNSCLYPLSHGAWSRLWTRPWTSSSLSDHAPSVWPNWASLQKGRLRPASLYPELSAPAWPPVRGHVALSHGSRPLAPNVTLPLLVLAVGPQEVSSPFRLLRGHRARLAGGQSERLYPAQGLSPLGLSSTRPLPSPCILNLCEVHGGDHGPRSLSRTRQFHSGLPELMDHNDLIACGAWILGAARELSGRVG